ncbi:MAG: TolC family protein [Alphaproteobacteria bacterium]|nr:TolC family protein [Alphaproteobacteria bacterium]
MKKLLYAFALLPITAFAEPDCATTHELPDTEMTLHEVVKMGLCRNPQTAAAYASLQSMRFSKNAGYSSYLPTVNLSGSASRENKKGEWNDSWQYSASIGASYLIFDFGKRLADMNQLISTYKATGFEFSDTVQNFVYGLVGSYYELLNADADVKAAQSALTVAQTAKDTADKKFKAGAVAKADVYKADTTLASSKLSLERAKNNREIAKGNLLTKLSFPATTDIKIADMSSTFGTEAENENIEELIELAKQKKPSLLRASAQKDAAWHKRNSAFLKNLPSFSLSGRINWGEDRLPGVFEIESRDRVSGSIGISASMPIFAGFSNFYSIRSAEADYDRAKLNEQNAENETVLDVFTAYQNYKTAQTVLKQAETLLKSATESERVTSGMYKVGRATMLDWQTAQSELVNARKQHNSAKYDLFIKRAAVALAIGDIKSGLEEMGNEQ